MKDDPNLLTQVREDDYYGGDVWLRTADNNPGHCQLVWRAWGAYGMIVVELSDEEAIGLGHALVAWVESIPEVERSF